MNKAVAITASIIVLGFIGLVLFLNRSSMKSDPQKNSAADSFLSAQPFATVVPQQIQNTQQDAQKNQPPVGVQEPLKASYSAVIKTVKGDITVKLYPQDAPKTVFNFITLAKKGYYNNLTFHRVEPNFVIQGGDPKGNGSGGVSIYGETFEDELNPNAESYKEGYKEGVLAMANRGPNTNGSQFFIMLEDNPSLPRAYTIFGKVTKGMDIVKKIEKGDKFTTISVEEK